MAINILPQNEGPGARIGSAVGGGMENLFKGLAEGKAKKMKADEFEKAGLPRVLAQLDPQAQAAYLRNYGATQQKNQEQAILDDIASGNYDNPDLADSGDLERSQQKQQINPEVLNAISQQLGLPSENASLQPQEVKQQLTPKQQVKEFKYEEKKNLSRRERIEKNIDNYQKALSSDKYNTDQRRIINKAVADSEKELETINEREDKLNADYLKGSKEQRDKLNQQAESAHDNLSNLERMEELEQEGKLDTPGYLEGLKEAGFDISNLMDEGSQEFQKIAVNFLKDAKNIFGARVSNFEIEQFLKGIPSLSQSPEGRKRVIANLKRFERGKIEHQKAYNDAYRSVLKENKGVIRPLDSIKIQEMTDDKMEKVRSKLYSQFKEDLKRKVPAGQNKVITALQVAAGKAIGKVPNILKGAAGGAGIGAGIGAAGGPIGTAGGAGLGALAGGLGLI